MCDICSNWLHPAPVLAVWAEIKGYDALTQVTNNGYTILENLFPVPLFTFISLE